VRRLLENGANSSFINRLLDPETDPKWLSKNPYLKMDEERREIPLPKKIFTNRENSSGFDISEKRNIDLLKRELKLFENASITAESIYENRNKPKKTSEKLKSISSGLEIGKVIYDDPHEMKRCLEMNSSNIWGLTKVTERSKILKYVADDIEKNPFQLIYYLINEAGKTVQNAIDEIREGIDFLRYYSEQILELSGENQLKGPSFWRSVICSSGIKLKSSNHLHINSSETDIIFPNISFGSSSIAM
jgi:RHH-type proline utilization regulon transcriptional repressor/proline dehydrogenase/delta 1-pyrroline-5-carboxylate dehydrogenase